MLSRVKPAASNSSRSKRAKGSGKLRPGRGKAINPDYMTMRKLEWRKF